MTNPYNPHEPSSSEDDDSLNNKKPPQEPLGKRIRDVVDGALSCEQRRDVQIQMLDQVFFELSMVLPKRMESELKDLFKMLSMVRAREQKPATVEALTIPPPDGYSPIKKFGLGFSNMFTEFTIDDFINLPGYIELHKVARQMDISINIMNVTAEEAKSGNPLFPSAAMLVANGLESYEDGWYKYRAIYPKLPPVDQPKNNKPKPGGNLHF
jgi:hypothetical protein